MEKAGLADRGGVGVTEDNGRTRGKESRGEAEDPEVRSGARVAIDQSDGGDKGMRKPSRA